MEDEVLGAEELGDEAEWSRAWEWPEWVREMGANARGLLGWRPDGRTFAMVVGIFEGSLLAGVVPGTTQLWRALTTTPDTLFGLPPGYTWERVVAGAYLGDGLAAVVTIVGAVTLLLAPQSLAGYVTVVTGLALRFASELGLTVAEAHLAPPASVIIGSGVTCLLTLLLIALAFRTAQHRRTT